MALVAIALLIAVGNFVIDKDDPNVSEAQASETTNAVAARVVMFTMPHDIKVMKLRWKQAAEARAAVEEARRERRAELKARFADERRTIIVPEAAEDCSEEDLIRQEAVLISVSQASYIKRTPLAAYRAQKRGGRGRSAAATREEDFIDQLWLVNTHDTLLTFTSNGKVFWLPVHQLPEAGSNAKGRPIINWIPLEEGEKVQAVLPVREYAQGLYVFFGTRNGTVKKTPLSEFAFRLARGKIAINLDDGDALLGAALTGGDADIMLFASNGKAVRFDEGAVRSMGRTATGVRGIANAGGAGVKGENTSTGDGVKGTSNGGFGVRGIGAIGVSGDGGATGIGLRGMGVDGEGIYGTSTKDDGVLGITFYSGSQPYDAAGVRGEANGLGAAGILGINNGGGFAGCNRFRNPCLLTRYIYSTSLVHLHYSSRYIGYDTLMAFTRSDSRYLELLKTPDQAVLPIQSDETIVYGMSICQPPALLKALADRILSENLQNINTVSYTHLRAPRPY